MFSTSYLKQAHIKYSRINIRFKMNRETVSVLFFSKSFIKVFLSLNELETVLYLRFQCSILWGGMHLGCAIKDIGIQYYL